MYSRLLICGLILGLGLALVSEAQARTWTVEKGGGGDFTVIQDALDEAAPGDTVLVGVGRFDDFAVAQGASELMIIAQFNTASLVLRGMGAEETILGPEVRLPDTLQLEYGIVRVEPGLDVSIENLAMVNSRAAVNNSGRVTLSGVLVKGHTFGIFDGSTDPLVVRDSRFEDCSDYGVRGGPQNTFVTVEDCTFFNVQGAVFFNQVESGIVRRCTFSADLLQRTMVMVTQGSIAVIEDCHFLESPEYVGVEVSAQAILNDNWFGLGYSNITARNGGHIAGSGNVLRGGVRAALFLFDRGTASFHGNDLYNPLGPTVEVNSYLSSPSTGLDLTNNWWNTTDPDSIEAKIIYTNVIPGVEVLWGPFLSGPVPVQEQSIGGLKSLFRQR